MAIAEPNASLERRLTRAPLRTRPSSPPATPRPHGAPSPLIAAASTKGRGVIRTGTATRFRPRCGRPLAAAAATFARTSASKAAATSGEETAAMGASGRWKPRALLVRALDLPTPEKGRATEASSPLARPPLIASLAVEESGPTKTSGAASSRRDHTAKARRLPSAPRAPPQEIDSLRVRAAAPKSTTPGGRAESGGAAGPRSAPLPFAAARQEGADLRLCTRIVDGVNTVHRLLGLARRRQPI